MNINSNFVKWAVYCFAILFFSFSSSSFIEMAWAQEGRLKWSFSTGDSIYASPAMAPDGTIYVGSYDEFFYAINPDGSKKWEYFTDLSIKSSAAIDEEGTLYFGANTDDMLFAITEDGDLKWSTKLHGWSILHVHATPAIGPDDTIYAGNTGIGLFWVDSHTGEKTCVHKTDYHRVYASAAITPGNIIYIGDDSGRLHSLGPGCQVNWTMKIGETKDRFYSSPAIGSDGTIYLATMTRNSSSEESMLLALEPDSRTIQWTFPTSQGMYSSPAIGSDGTIYIGSRDNHVYAVNPDGTQKWAFETGDDVDSSPAIGADGTIYVGSNDHKLYAIHSDGTLKWSYETTDAIVSSPAIGPDGTVYVGSCDGKLYAVEGDSGGLAISPWPMFHHDLRHTGLYVDPNVPEDGEYRYYIPLFSCEAGHATGIGLSNSNETNAAIVSICVYDTTGVKRNAYQMEIPSNGQGSQVIRPADGYAGWMWVASTQPLTGVCFFAKAGAGADNYIADVPIASIASTAVHVPHVAFDENWDTTLYLANPNAGSQAVSIEITNSDGTLVKRTSCNLQAYGGGEYELSKLLSNQTLSGGKVRLSSSEGIVAFALYDNVKTGSRAFAGINAFDSQGVSSESSGYESMDQSSNYYLPLFSSTAGYATGLALSNCNAEAQADVTITVFDTEGNKRNTYDWTLPPDGQHSDVLKTSTSFTGSISIESTQRLDGVCFLAATGTGGDNYMADIPIAEAASKILHVPHVAADDNWDTTLYVSNPNAASQSVTINVIGSNGARISTTTRNLNAFGSGEYALSDLVSEQTVTGGKVKLISPDGIVAFALYDNTKTGARAFAGINAVDPNATE